MRRVDCRDLLPGAGGLRLGSSEGSHGWKAREPPIVRSTSYSYSGSVSEKATTEFVGDRAVFHIAATALHVQIASQRPHKRRTDPRCRDEVIGRDSNTARRWIRFFETLRR